MKINNLTLKNFRNFKSFEVEFSIAKTLIIGPNGAGKSNILEAVYLLSSGDSNRAVKEDEMVRFGAGYAKVLASTTKEKGDVENLDLTLTVSPTGRPSKVGKVNGIKRSLGDLSGELKAVEFSPSNLDLVNGSPDVRRRYLNSVLCQIKREYRDSYRHYEKIRKQKNALLGQITEGAAKPSQVDLWNEKILEFGRLVQEIRQEYFTYLSKNVVDIAYDYRPSALSEERLLKYKDAEIAAGVSLIGPHRDDFVFMAQTDGAEVRNLALFGSRGQQRIAVFELKLGEIGYFKDQTGDRPVLLLDDIFSELDGKRRQEVLTRIGEDLVEQVIFTATDEAHVGVENLRGMKVIKL